MLIVLTLGASGWTLLAGSADLNCLRISGRVGAARWNAGVEPIRTIWLACGAGGVQVHAVLAGKANQVTCTLAAVVAALLAGATDLLSARLVVARRALVLALVVLVKVGELTAFSADVC